MIAHVDVVCVCACVCVCVEGRAQACAGVYVPVCGWAVGAMVTGGREEHLGLKVNASMDRRYGRGALNKN